jgi:DNA-directed RNA polymerase specialized sigma24 family protein
MSEPLSPEQFDTLLHRLGPDRELAGTRYEQLRRRLITLFDYRGCPHPEELADETLDRAARRLEEMGTEFVGSDPARFVYGVAWNVARESFRRRSTVSLPERWEGPGPAEPPGAEDEERERMCLDRCLDRLLPAERRLVLAYFEGERGARIRRRSELATELSLSLNALRLKIHRLNGRLRECVVRCLDPMGRAGAAALRGVREAME